MDTLIKPEHKLLCYLNKCNATIKESVLLPKFPRVKQDGLDLMKLGFVQRFIADSNTVDFELTITSRGKAYLQAHKREIAYRHATLLIIFLTFIATVIVLARG